MLRNIPPLQLYLIGQQIICSEKDRGDEPFFVIHGVHDHIFDIRSVLSTCGLLDHLGYNLRFDELPTEPPLPLAF